MEATGEKTVQIDELAGYRLWHLLLQARFFDNESLAIELGKEEEEAAWMAFCEKHKMDPSCAAPVPREFYGCGPLQLREAAAREARISMWKESEFGSKVEDYFERRRGILERVVYSLLRVREAGIARELWFRIHEGEASFSDLAPNHAGGPERLTGGIIGPVTLGSMHSVLAESLKTAREGELLSPFPVGSWHLVVRLEKRIPAVLDAQLRAALLEELATKQMEEYASGERNGY